MASPLLWDICFTDRWREHREDLLPFNFWCLTQKWPSCALPVMRTNHKAPLRNKRDSKCLAVQDSRGSDILEWLNGWTNFFFLWIQEDLDLGSTHHIGQASVMDVNFTILSIKTCHRISPYSRGEERNVTSWWEKQQSHIAKEHVHRKMWFLIIYHNMLPAGFKQPSLASILEAILWLWLSVMLALETNLQ